MAPTCKRDPHIRRIDNPAKQLVGWVVHVSHEGRRFRRYFSDKQFGSRDSAYTAAQQLALAWGDRSEVVALLRWLKPRQNSRSGTPGVARYEGKPGRGRFWLAYWDEDGRRVQKEFSISVHGEERARELAFKIRQRAMREHVRRLAQLRKHDAAILKGLTKGHPQRLNTP